MMSTQTSTVAQKSPSFTPANSTLIHGRPGFVTGFEREQELAAMHRRMNQPIVDTGRALSIVTGMEGNAPIFALALLAETQGLTCGQMAAKLHGVMRAALYLSDAKVAELRRASDPARIEDMAAAVALRHGVAYLEDLDTRDRLSYGEAGVFPKPVRDTVANDAAYRWSWARFPRTSI
jgi:hypothetical protein